MWARRRADLPIACCSTARRAVVAIDTGYGQIAHKLRVDPRVRLMERTNARHAGAGQGHGQRMSRLRFFAMDVIVYLGDAGAAGGGGGADACGDADGEAVVLVKPQFEAGREHVGKGGIVRDPAGASSWR